MPAHHQSAFFLLCLVALTSGTATAQTTKQPPAPATQKAPVGKGTPASRPAAANAAARSRASFVTCARTHTLALMEDGTVRAWGDNESGQLGNGTTVRSDLPIVVKGLSGVIAVATGDNTTTPTVISPDSFGGGTFSRGKTTTVGYSLALKKDGTVWAWGNGASGQLGTGKAENRSIPARITELEEITAVAAGATFGVALQRDGSVWTWGVDDGGQLGNGTPSPQGGVTLAELAHPKIFGPARVTGLTDITQISVGGEGFCLAVKRDGTAWGWGWGGNGELGTGERSGRTPTPVRVKDLTGVQAVAAGYDHGLALLQDGTVRAWGWRTLGNERNASTLSVVPFQLQPLTEVTAISARGGDSFAVTKDGTLWAWGDNSEGQLGTGEATPWDSTPRPVSGIKGVVTITAGISAHFAQTQDGAMWTWGNALKAPKRIDRVTLR